MPEAWNAAILYDNLIDAASITASSFAITTPPTRLQNPHIARVWRGIEGDSEYLIVDHGALVEIDTGAVIGTNLGATGVTRHRLSTADSSGQTGDAHDSTAVTGAIDPAYGNLIDLLETPVMARYQRFDLSQAGLEYIEAGRLVGGLRHQFSINFAYNWSEVEVDRSRKVKGRGGQTFVDFDNSYRSIEIAFEMLSGADRNSFVRDADLLNGASRDVLLILNPASDNLSRDSIWGLVTDVTPVSQPTVPGYFAKTYRVEERL